MYNEASKPSANCSNATTGELNLGVSYAFTSLLLPALAAVQYQISRYQNFIIYGNPERVGKKTAPG
jgi:LysR family cyn operon transcriptional activator